MPAIEIVIVPASNPGTYWPVVDGQRLTRATRQPFFDGARALLADGVSPDVPLISRHEGSQTIAMQSTVGEAARWSVSESDRGGLRRQLWKPFENGRHSCAGNSSGDDDGLEGNSLPDAPTIHDSAVGLCNPSPVMALNGERKPLPCVSSASNNAGCVSDQAGCETRGGILHEPGSKVAADFAAAQSDFGRRLVPRHMPRVNPELTDGDGA